MSDIWERLIRTGFARNSDVDRFLQGRTLDGSSNRCVLDVAKSPKGLELPVFSGTRVAFKASEEALFTYRKCPEDGTEGTVVTVRTACGDLNTYDGRVFVLWDDRSMTPIHTRHLRRARTPKRVATTFRKVVGSNVDLKGFAKRGNDLVHKATKDLWAFRQDGDQFVIERLFEDNGTPLKV